MIRDQVTTSREVETRVKNKTTQRVVGVGAKVFETIKGNRIAKLCGLALDKYAEESQI
jgi:hypothetical protein